MKREYAEACPPLLKDFLYYMETIRGRSPRTVDGYFIDLRTFLRYIKAVKVLGLREFDLSEITIDDLDSSVICGVTLSDIYGYLNFTLTERDNSAVTRARKVSSIRSFYKYITTKTDLLEVSPAKELDLPAIRNSLPKFLSLEESLDLLQTVAAAQNPRDFCMITFLINCGMRVSELVGLNLSDLRKKEKTLRLLGKGNKERIVYLNEACQEAIRKYLAVRPVDGVKDKKALFLSRLKQRISLQGVHFVVKGYLQQVDGAQGYSTHKLRHTAATLMYQQGGVDIRVLKDILGHENLGTTEIYTHLSSEQIRTAAENNPLSHVKMRKKAPDKPAKEGAHDK